MAYLRQSGSTLSFALVGTLLAVLLVGGIILVRQANLRVAKSPSTTTSTTPQPSPQPSGNSTATNQPESTSSGTGSSSSSTSTPTATTNSESTTSPTSTPSATTPTAGLPVTGPSDSLWTIFALGILAWAATAYRKSRSPLLT